MILRVIRKITFLPFFLPVHFFLDMLPWLPLRYPILLASIHISLSNVFYFP